MHFKDVFVSIDSSEQSDGFLCLCKIGEMGIGNDEGDFEDFFDAVTTSEDERGNSGGGNGRGDSVSFLIEVDLDMPFSPCLGGSETTSTTAHVTEGGLSRTVSSSTTDTRNTSNSSSSTPGFGRSLCLADSGERVDTW